MNGAHGPLDRLEARLERLTARVDELERIVASREATRPIPKRKPRRHAGHASRI